MSSARGLRRGWRSRSRSIRRRPAQALRKPVQRPPRAGLRRQGATPILPPPTARNARNVPYSGRFQADAAASGAAGRAPEREPAGSSIVAV